MRDSLPSVHVQTVEPSGVSTNLYMCDISNIKHILETIWKTLHTTSSLYDCTLDL